MAVDPVGLAYLQHASSPLHRLNPSSKMIWLVCVVALSFTHRAWDLLVFSVLGLLVALTLTGTDRATAWKPIRLLLILWGPFVLLPPLAFQAQSGLMGSAASDTAVLSILGFNLEYSRSGLEYGTVIFLRGFVVAIACVTVAWTTHPRDIVHSLTESAHLPYRFAWAIFLAIIYTPLILHEYEVITHAQAVRGLRNRRGPMGMVDTVRNTFFPLLIRGLRKGSMTSLAMESRAFGSAPTRVFRTALPHSPMDGLVQWGSLLAVVGYFGWLLLQNFGVAA